MRRGAAAWVPAVLWAAAVFWASAQPTVPLPAVWAADKLAHFGTYAVLGVLLAHGASASALPAGWAVALGVLYGASDELHQAFVPGRSAELADWAADALGVLAGVLLHHHVQSARRTGSAPSGPLPEP